MKTADYDFTIPASAIAQHPLPEREGSRLLHLAGGRLSHHVFRDLPNLLRRGDLLVLNRSRVFPARLLGTRPRGGAAEALLVRRVGGDTWEALLRPGRRLRAGDAIQVAPELRWIVEPGTPSREGRRRVRLEAAAGLTADEAIERYGHTPLPPYISRPDTGADRERYQAVYAREVGSIAAPTAGLHFTRALLERLEQHGVGHVEIVLHVGPGTFRPIKSESVDDHNVEAEPYWIPAATAEALERTRAAGGRVIAVGSTSTRALEAAAATDGRVHPGAGETDLMIRPGHRFRAVDGLITNLHLPRSSLLVLVAALAGRQAILDAYAEALRCGYRFYSYGDAMLIL